MVLAMDVEEQATSSRIVPNPHKSSLNSKRGGKKCKAPPATTKKETETSSPAEDTSPEEEQTPEDGPEQV